MRTSLLALALTVAASLASADVVVTRPQSNQLVEKMPGDCFFGVVTPQGCA